MRKIEKEMLQALSEGCNWSKDNTQVQKYMVNGVTGLQVVLHGNPIYRKIHDNNGTIKEVWSWGNYRPSNTTASRLRALGVKYDRHLPQSGWYEV